METKAGNLEGLAESSAKQLDSQAKFKDVKGADESKTEEEEVPDPDEDDLDDLDDMLDEFSAPKDSTQQEGSVKSGPGRPVTSPPEDQLNVEGLTDDDFVKQFEAGMADLMGELESSPEMKTQFETMMKELGDAAPEGDKTATSQPAATSSKAESSAPGEEAFQETIRKTMERMQASSKQATDAAVADDSDDILAELMKQMQSGGMGDGSEEDFSKMLLGMMEQLTNKDILYEPMKELHDKFPSWMENNEAVISKDDRTRYKEQQTLVSEIVAKFEEKTYTDSNVEDREYIVERMQKMQAAGSPPPDLVGDMATAQEAFSAPEEGCPQQ